MNTFIITSAICIGIFIFIMVAIIVLSLCRAAGIADEAFKESIRRQRDELGLNTTITSGCPVIKE